VKKLMNEPGAFVDQMLEGLLLAHPDRLKSSGGTNRALVRCDRDKFLLSPCDQLTLAPALAKASAVAWPSPLQGVGLGYAAIHPRQYRG
jgi:hypothetical protein